MIRDGAPLFPTGDTRLQAGDEIIALTTSGSEPQLRAQLWTAE